ncbi:MAG: flagellar basal body P-ring protein FlgI [Pseudomonadota bacterium]
MNEPVQASQPLNRIALKDLGRLQGWRDNALVGYGLVTGLAGSGDTRRSAVTRVALRNVLNRLGTNVADEQISTRNIAVVLVTGRLPPSANVGDQIDVTVSSIGDARSLAGGTLLMTPLMGPDRMVYALAQGGLVTGGYRFEAQLNREQSNYPTSATLPNGATVERAVQAQLLSSDNSLSFILREPSFTTAQRIADAVNVQLGAARASVVSADEVHIMVDPARGNLPRFIAMLENLAVVPDRSARIVINEKSGTVVAGGDVRLSSIVISQGDLRISVISDNEGSQPSFIGGFATDISSLIITNTQLTISEGGKDVAMQFPNTSVASLVEGLNRAEVDTRRIISILQAIKAAGALHAEIIVQ